MCYIVHYESLQTQSTEVTGKGESWMMKKNREKEETIARSLRTVDLEKSECSVKNGRVDTRAVSCDDSPMSKKCRQYWMIIISSGRLFSGGTKNSNVEILT